MTRSTALNNGQNGVKKIFSFVNKLAVCFVFSLFALGTSADSYENEEEFPADKDGFHQFGYPHYGYGYPRYRRHGSPTPEGYEQYLVFLGNGVWRSPDGSNFVDGLIEGDGMNFQRKVMGRSDEEIEEQRQLAIDFFLQRFGLDVVNDTENLYFTGLEVDPRNRMRAYTISGVHVPRRGWKVRDGGWGVFVINPEGVTLGGEFEGMHIPVNSGMVYGEYNIRVPFKENIVIQYESDFPFIADQFGAGAIRCKLFSEDFGEGLAGGIVNPVFLDDNFLIQQDIRNILTFPAVP